MTDYSPFDVLDHTDHPGRVHGLVLVCDHASNIVPPGVTPLGISDADMNRHIAWDVGADSVTRQLAEALGARAVLSRFSRLVIDPNRGEDDPTLVMRLYDGTIVPGNRHVDAEEVERRKALCYRPYHAALEDLAARVADTVIVSVHSFTPQLAGRPPRPWQIGILYASDARLSRPLIDRLSTAPDLCVGENEPYAGHLPGDAISRHALAHGRHNTLIELRNDLIRTEAQQRAWADRLAPVLKTALADIEGA